MRNPWKTFPKMITYLEVKTFVKIKEREKSNEKNKMHNQF